MTPTDQPPTLAAQMEALALVRYIAGLPRDLRWTPEFTRYVDEKADKIDGDPRVLSDPPYADRAERYTGKSASEHNSAPAIVTALRQAEAAPGLVEALEPFARWARWALETHQAIGNDRRFQEVPGMLRNAEDAWAFQQQLSPDEPRLRLGAFRALLEALSRQDGATDDLTWFSGQVSLSLEHYSPVYGDDDDQSREWQVQKEDGGINDREWTIIGRGETAAQAITSARATMIAAAPATDVGEG